MRFVPAFAAITLCAVISPAHAMVPSSCQSPLVSYEEYRTLPLVGVPVSNVGRLEYVILGQRRALLGWVVQEQAENPWPIDREFFVWDAKNGKVKAKWGQYLTTNPF